MLPADARCFNLATLHKAEPNKNIFKKNEELKSKYSYLKNKMLQLDSMTNPPQLGFLGGSLFSTSPQNKKNIA